VIVEPVGHEELERLMREVYGSTMSAAEFDWWFDRNPAGPRILNGARDDDGSLLGALAMSPARLSSGPAAFAIHAVTTPAARGRGVFSALELHNEERAGAAGAGWALGFTNPMAGPILVGRLGWEDVTSLRIWVRPKRLRRRGTGALRTGPDSPPFARGAEQDPTSHHIVKDARYLDWRYADSPRPYLRLDGRGDGWAVVRLADWHGYSAAVICDAFGPRLSELLRKSVAVVDADLAVAMVNPGEERIYIAAGFVPSPRSIRFIGKRLADDAPALPKQRAAWRFSLGDLDFF
jgi:GNAT superfamily N-acetyltransferase